MYQVIVGKHGGVMWSKEDGAVRLSESDLWGETRLGAPTIGGVWDRVQGQRTREGGELRQDSEAGEEGGEQGHSEEGNREDEGGELMTWRRTGEATHRREARRSRETE